MYCRRKQVSTRPYSAMDAYRYIVAHPIKTNTEAGYNTSYQRQRTEAWKQTAAKSSNSNVSVLLSNWPQKQTMINKRPYYVKPNYIVTVWKSLKIHLICHMVMVKIILRYIFYLVFPCDICIINIQTSKVP